MASTSGLPSKKLKIHKETVSSITTNVDLVCPTTGICLEDLNQDKFGLLLSVVYPLNKSRTKTVVIGLQLKYEKPCITPVVGIMDQRCKGVLFNEASWSELTNCFADIKEYFCRYSKKFIDRLDKPEMFTGFSVMYTQLSFSGLKPKAVCLCESDPTAQEESAAGEIKRQKSSVTMQDSTFETLYELESFITEYLSQLRGVTLAVQNIITALIDFSKADLTRIGFDNEIEHFTSEVIRQVAKKSLFKELSLKQIESKMDFDKNVLNFKRVVKELCVYHSDFLIYNVFRKE